MGKDIFAKAHVRPARAMRPFLTTRDAPPAPDMEGGDWQKAALNLARLAESYQVAYINSRDLFIAAMDKAGVKIQIDIGRTRRANVAHAHIERLLKDPDIIDAMNAVKRHILLYGAPPA